MKQNAINHIPEGFLKKWQEIADLIADIINIPAVLIMKTDNEFMEVFVSSKTQGNPYNVGDKEHWHGLYCETVIKTQNKLRITNALKDKKWDKNPDIKIGMIAYLGFALNFPDKQPFGTLCVLDNKERHFTAINEKLLLQFKKVIELDMALIATLELTEKNSGHDVVQKLIDSNEEYQAINEEFQTTNEELKQSYDELFHAKQIAEESEEKYRRIADNVTDVVWITDLKMNPTYISPSVERVFGVKPEDYLKLPINYTYPPASLDKFKKKLTKELAKEQDPKADKERVFQLEVERYYTDGTIGWDAISATFLRDEQMNPIAIQGVSRDITERVKAEEALRESESRFQKMLGVVPDMISIQNAEMDILYSNWHGFAEVPEKKQVFNTKCYKTYRNFDDICPDCLAKFVFESRKPIQKEVRLPDGKWYDIRVIPMLDKDNNVEMFMEWVRDITKSKQAEEAMRESRDLLNFTQRIARIGGWVWDVENEMMTWADETYYIHGMEPGEIAGNSPEHIQRSLSCYDKEDRTKIEAAFRRCVEEGKAYSFEFPITTVQGERKWINTSAQAVMEDSRVKKVYGHIMDITKRKNADIALVQNNKTLLQLNNFSIELSKITLEDNIEAFIAKTIKELTGAKLAVFSEYNTINKTLRVRHIEMKQGLYKKAVGLLGKKADQMDSHVSDKMYHEITSKIIGFKKTLHEATLGAVSRSAGTAIQTLLKVDRFIGLAYLVEGKLYGTTMLAMDKEQPDLSKQTLEAFCYMVATALQRRQTEVSLKESEERFRALHNASFGGIAIHDKGIIIECNQGLSKMTGYSQDELIGMDGLLLIAPESRDMVMKNILSGYEKPYEAFGLKKNNEKYAIRLEARNIPYKGKNVITTEFRDITERKKGEMLLKEKNEAYESINEELKQTNNELITAKEKAEESDRLKSAFLANMSHEIRTPMNGILGFANFLKKPNLTGEQQQKYVSVIEDSGARMLNIINDIIDISKIEAGLMKLNMGESNINEQTEYIYTFFRPEVEAKGMKLSLSNALAKEESVIYTDREKVYAILTNLVKNAIKYSNQGTIAIGYKMVEKQTIPMLQFCVKDTGIGIPKEKQKVIFERFMQTEIEDKMARQGAGLGLSITKAYVKMLGGEIWVESKVDIGSTFYFTLPYKTSREENIHQNDLSSEAVHSPKFIVSGLKILIAEDNEISQLMLEEEFSTNAKEILVARTGVEAVEACRDNADIDLVLMDIRMPKMNGYEAANKIRQFNKDVVIIAQTAYGLTGDREKALEAGCNDYIAKPIDLKKLYALIKKHTKAQK